MIKLLFLIPIALIGCVKKANTGFIYKPPTNCSVIKVGSIATITCPDGTSTVITDGSNGVNGAVGGTGPTGPQGDPGDDGQDGATGGTGPTGNPGLNGSNGHSAAFSVVSADLGSCPSGGSVISLGVDLNDDTLLQLVETTQAAIICNGNDGATGATGSSGTNGTNAPPTPFSPVGILNPCGDAPGIDDEVFLRLYNGDLLWSQSQNSSGLNTRFAQGRSGTWGTTDGDGCIFTLDASLNITYENHHY